MESFRDTNYEVRQAALDISGCRPLIWILHLLGYLPWLRPQALATCTCAHLVILALSEDDSGMIIHVRLDRQVAIR